MTILRVSKDKNNPYVLINKSFLLDPNISLRLKGFLAYCLSLPDDWEFHVTQLSKVLKESRDTLYSIINEGMDHGYISRGKQKTNNGKFGASDYVIHESQIQKISTVSENPYTASTYPENPTLLSNNKTKKDSTKSDSDPSASAKESTSSKVDKSTPPSADALELYDAFVSALTRKKPDIRLGKKEKWLKDCAKLLKHRKLEELKQLISWMETQDKTFAFIQCPDKLYKNLDTQEMLMLSDVKKRKMNTNRLYAQMMKAEMPQKLSKMGFDAEFVYNLGEGTGMALECDPEEFKRDFMKLWEKHNG